MHKIDEWVGEKEFIPFFFEKKFCALSLQTFEKLGAR